MQEAPDGRYPTDVDGLIGVIDDARSSLERVVKGKSEPALTERRDQGGWSVKDHFYHLATWQRGLNYLLQKRPFHEGMSLDERSYHDLTTDEKNAIIFSQSRDLSLREVMDAYHSTYRETVDLLSSMSFDDLQRPVSHYVDGSQDDSAPTMLDEILETTAGHYDEHREWIEEILT
jgi:hypothetical protein